MRVQLSNVIKGLPLVVAAFVVVSATAMSTGAAYANPGNGNDNGNNANLKQVFCNIQGESGTWKAQIGGPNTEHEYPYLDAEGKNVFLQNENQVTEAMDIRCQELYGDEEPEVNYCDPSQKPGGVSIAEWVPKNVNCVDFTVVEKCGELGVNLINDTTLNYAVSWSEGEADWNFDTALPATFEEDYNGGSVDVYYWLVGEEADYVTNRGIYNYWEQENPGAGMVTVDTDCETTTVPEDDDEEETNGTVVLGTSTDTPARAGELPTSLPVTGANEQLAAIVTIVSTIATAAGVYTLRGRSADLPL